MNVDPTIRVLYDPVVHAKFAEPTQLVEFRRSDGGSFSYLDAQAYLDQRRYPPRMEGGYPPRVEEPPTLGPPPSLPSRPRRRWPWLLTPALAAVAWRVGQVGGDLLVGWLQ
jgi:hypothetical protein